MHCNVSVSENVLFSKHLRQLTTQTVRSPPACSVEYSPPSLALGTTDQSLLVLVFRTTKVQAACSTVDPVCTVSMIVDATDKFGL